MQYLVFPIPPGSYFRGFPTKVASPQASWVADLNLSLSFPSNLYGVSGISGAASPIVVGVHAYGGQPFRWQAGSFTDLSPVLPSGFDAHMPAAINYQGQVLGFSSNGNDPAVEVPHAWLLSGAAPAVDLSATTQHALDFPQILNENDQIAGYSQVPEVAGTDKQAYFYDLKSDTFVTLPQTFHELRSLTDHGAVVGSYHGISRIYDHGTGNETVIPGLPGDGFTDWVAMNNNHDLAGTSIPAFGGGWGRGFIASYANGQVTNVQAIDDLIPDGGTNGWTIIYTGAINDNGEIFAYARWKGSAVPTQVLLIPSLGPLQAELPWFAAYVQILFGVINDAPGAGLGRHGPYRIDPHWGDPVVRLSRAERDLVLGIGIADLAKAVSDPTTRAELHALGNRLARTAATYASEAPVATRRVEALRAMTSRRRS
jgi:hypothetical protein